MAGKEDFVAGRNPTGDEELGEFVSALLDGEVEHLSDQTLSELVEAEHTRASWARYQLIGEVVRESAHDEKHPMLGVSFAERLRIQIESEPTVLAPKRRAKREMPSYLQPTAGFALAASVAGVAVIGVQNMSGTGAEEPQPLSVANIEAAEQVLAAATSDEGADTPELEIDLAEHKRRLNSYLVNFNEQRAGLGMPGVNPYVRIIDFESEK